MTSILRRNILVKPLLTISFLLLLMGLPGSSSHMLNLLRPTVKAATTLTFAVNSTADLADSNPGDGICNDGGGTCTLRAAVQEANAASSADTINFNLPANSIITLNTQLPAFIGNISIVGPGSSLLTIQRSSAAGTPIFQVFSFAPINGNFNDSVSSLTILNGNATGDAGSNMSGGGITNFWPSALTLTDVVIGGSTSTNGGGLYNGGTATLTNCKVTGNNSPNGGGILNSPQGTLTVINSSVSDNLASNGSGGGILNLGGTVTITGSTVSGNTSDAQGGGIFNKDGFDGAGSVTLTNSTVSGNNATGILGSGVGGISNNAGANTLTLINTTVTANTASGSGSGVAGIFNGSGSTANLKNSIVAQNTSALMLQDLNGTFNSQGYNLIGKSDGTNGFTNGVNGDQVGTNATPIDPKLGMLTDNAGPTKTHALLVGSPAIDAGNSALTTDQRGQPRPVDDPIVTNAAGGNASDIGAYEAHNLEVNSTADTDDGLCRALGTGNGCTLREAINAANNESGAELITFAPALTSGGPATLTLLSALPNLSSELTITGPGSNLLTVQRSTAGGTPSFRIFQVDFSTVSISGLTITNGRTADGVAGTNGTESDDGGGIRNTGTLTLADVSVIANRTGDGGAGLANGGIAGFGGGIANSGTLTITNCIISQNDGGRGGDGGNNAGDGGSGGGIFNEGTMTMTGCIVDGNNAGRGGDGSNGGRGGNGGGIQDTEGTVTLTNVTISNNAAGDSGNGSFGGFGGGIFVAGNLAVVTMVNSSVTGNSSGSSVTGTAGFGGGIMGFGALFITGSTISGNTSGGPGGGIMVRSFLRLSNSTVSGNQAQQGGGIYSDGSTTIALTNATVTGNSAGNQGNGVMNHGAASVRNSIIAGNGAPGAPDLGGSTSFNSQGHNLIGNADGGSGFTAVGDQAGTTAAPINPGLGPLANNGGPTATHALLSGSLAIDGGDNCILNNSCSPPLNSALTTDQRGSNRATDGNGDGVSVVDIGAYEVQIIRVENTADSGAGSLRQAITDANSTPGAAVINFQGDVTGTITLLTALPDLSTSMDINGPGATQLTIRRSTAGGTPDFRIFTINSGKLVAISGLTISNGSAPTGGVFPANSGGAILNLGSLQLSNTVVTGNTAQQGGGISSSGPLTLQNAIVSGNTATSGGGGISTQGGSSPITISDSTISGNTTNGSGGGLLNIRLAATMTLTISNSTISGNNAIGGNGGGIYNSGTQGAILNVTLTNVTISGNNSGFGGGIANSSETTGTTVNMAINNGTIWGNSVTGAVTQGGGIANHVFGSTNTLTLRNTMVAGNLANSGANSSDVSSPVDPASSFNLIGDGTAMTGISNGTNGNIVGTAVAPISPRVGPLASNGGPTQTHALLAGSPALDAGNKALVTNPPFSGPPFTDQRGPGFVRIVDGPDGDTTDTVDIGAFEAQVSVADIANQAINEDGSLSLPFNLGGAANITGVTATSSNTALVPNNPASISVSGSGSGRTLQINPVPNASGTSTITVTVSGNNSQTMTDTFLFTVNPANDAPSFTKGSDQTVNENAGAQTVNNWASNISAGPIDESGQSLTFMVTNNSNAALFVVAPAISSSGTLTYTAVTGMSGTATITIALQDDGGTANGGVNTSATQSFNITVLDGGALQFTAATLSAAENVGNAIITVTRTGGTAGEARINYATSNGTATAGQDYTAASGTLIFPDGVASQTFNVAVTNDAIDEPDETVNLTLTIAAGTGSLGTPAGAVLTITDNDPAPSLSINDVAVTEGNSGTINATFTVTLSGQTAQTVTVRFETADGTAVTIPAPPGVTPPGSDYFRNIGVLTFAPTETTKSFGVAVIGEFAFEPNETFFVNLDMPTNATISDAQGTGTINNDDAPGGTLAFDSPVFTVTELAGRTLITVERKGDTSQPATVDYATADVTADGRKDYTPVSGTLHFDAGIPARDIQVLVNIDAVAEGTELLEVTLSNPTGGAQLGAQKTATLQIENSFWNSPPANSIDHAESFVRQHYHDFLNRDAGDDPDGLAFWTNQITECQQPGATCNAELRRINVSAAFYLSIEFQETGYLVYRMYKAGYGNINNAPVPLTFAEFLPDTQQIGEGVVVGRTGWEQRLENNKIAYSQKFVSLARFLTAYPTTLSPSDFVDALYAHAGVTPSPAERLSVISEFGTAANTADAAVRARALRRVAENSSLKQQELNKAFVLMQYFGYLRRNPYDPPEANLDFGGYNFWLGKLNQFNGNFVDAEMVKAFIVSGEYRQRFGP